ncbi:hypothetical protein V5F77_05830 [Xanthobacter sp. DSM 24535]|uniref:hypothetical protein n=1 Tax=Roseixanthobacter psychrophilus TaxID=3119917 RepID=UPI003729EE7F
MTRDEFEHLLAVHGADLERWPQAARGRAQALIRRDSACAAVREATAALDARLARSSAAGPTAEDLAAGARVAARLAGMPLPKQTAGAPVRWLPSWLLALDLRPSWPSLAALAGMALLGFFAGLTVVHPEFLDAAPGRTVVAADLSAIVFEPGPTGGSAL